VRNFPILDSLAEVDAFERTPARGTDMEMMGFHPMATARLGPDPARLGRGQDLRRTICRGSTFADASVFPSAVGSTAGHDHEPRHPARRPLHGRDELFRA